MTLRLFGDLKDAGALDEWSRPTGGGAQFPAIRPTRNGNPSTCLPESGMGVTVPMPADASWSAWYELTPGLAQERVLATLNCGLWHREVRDSFVQLGTGAEGSESVIAEGYDQLAGGVSPGNPTIYPLQLPLDGLVLPLSTRLAARARLRQAGTADYHQVGVAVAAMPSPPLFSADWDEEAYRKGVTSIQIVPAIPAFTTITGGATAENWGDWYEFVASAAHHLLVPTLNVRFSAKTPAPYSQIRLQVGTGATGNEVAHEALPFPRAEVGQGGRGRFALPRPVEVMQGERVVVRLAAGEDSNPADVSLVLHNLNF